MTIIVCCDDLYHHTGMYRKLYLYAEPSEIQALNNYAMNILVPVDFGKEAENAKKFASAVAKSSKGKITFLYAATPIYNFASIAEESHQSIVKQAKGLMGKYITELKKLGVKGSYRIIVDNLASAIESILMKEEIDIIIMGTKGAKGIKKHLLGSNAGEILKEVDVPVLIVPIAASFDKLERIVLTMEYPEQAPEYINKILQLTINWGLTYDILHFSPDANEVFEEIIVKHIKVLEEIYPGTSFGFSNRFSSNIQVGLELFQKEHPEAMLVMLSAHKSLLEKYFYKSDTEQMVYHADLPVMIIKEDSIK